MYRYYVEFALEKVKYLYVMAYSVQHVKDMFPDYNITTIDQTD